jgi:uncharacterized repeat protein (TIGR01451 family)
MMHRRGGDVQCRTGAARPDRIDRRWRHAIVHLALRLRHAPDMCGRYIARVRLCQVSEGFAMFATRRGLLFPIAALLALGLSASADAQVSLTTIGVPVTQNFNTLPASGSATWTNNSTIPGWFHARTGTGTTVVANDGSSNAGNLYSYGTGTATDRALGSLGSGNAAIGNLFYGVRLQNNTGATITALDVSYTGEQWRNSAAAAQSVAFSYLVGSPTVTGSLAEFQSAGVAVPALDFTSPITGGTAGALDGNLAANRVAIMFSITGLSIPNGTEVMLRWADPDHTGADHGLSIDEVSVMPLGGAGASADLSITKTDSPDPVNAGGNITYTITATNAGPDVAISPTLTDTLPPNTTFVSLTSPGWGCSAPAIGTGGTVSCSTASFPPGSAAFTLVLNVDAGTANGTVISNTAALASTTSDPDSSNNTATATTTVIAPSADLAVTLTDSPDPVSPGGNITYTITATNNGPDPATNASFSDTVGAGMTFVSLAQPGGWSCTTPAVGAGGLVSCSNASFAVGSASFTLVTAVDAGLSGGSLIFNTASITSSATDPNAGNNSATTTTTVGVLSADLSVTKTDSPDPVTAGSNITYTIVATNAGPESAASVSLGDTLPAATTFVSLSAPAGWSCTTPAVGAGGAVSCSIASLAPGSATFTLVTNVIASTAAGTVISNTATIASSTTDPTPGNNSATTTTDVATPTSISGAKTVAGTFGAGDAITYTITLANAGSIAQGDNPGDEFTDVLPAELTLVSASASSGSATTAGNTANWNGSIPGGGSVTITINATINAGTAGGTIVSNQGTIRSDSDGNGTNDLTGATDDPGTGLIGDPTVFVVTTPATAISGTKTVAGTFGAGDAITYTITLTNTGGAQADNASDEFFDLLPPTLTLVSATANSGTAVATLATNTVVWNGAITAGGSVTITIDATINAAAAAGTTISNQGVIHFDADGNGTNETTVNTDDPATGAANDPTSFIVTAPPTTITGTKTVSGSPAPGSVITYTIVLSNGGGAQADNPGDEFTDVLPAGLVLVSASANSGTATATLATNTVTWNGAIAAGGSVTLTINAAIDAGVAPGTTITNQGTISFDADGNGSNESTAITDDPATQQSPDGTSLTVLGIATAIPLLGSDLQWLLIAALVALAMTALHRRSL